MPVKRYLFFCLLMVVAFGCNNKKLPKDNEIVTTLKEMEELTTVEYTLTKVVKANDNKTWFKAGERRILITTEAIVKAGINLEDLGPDDIIRDGTTITLRLPPPSLLSVNLPPEKIKVAFEKTGLFRDPFSGKERDALMVQAEEQIRNSGEALGIINQAKINTQLFLSRFLLQLGFKKVLISFDKPLTHKL